MTPAALLLVRRGSAPMHYAQFRFSYASNIIKIKLRMLLNNNYVLGEIWENRPLLR